MKKSLFTLATLSVLALLTTASAQAYTAKSETQMKQECAEKWKKEPTKVPACINGKKAYQARMEKTGGKTKAPKATKADKVDNAVKAKKADAKAEKAAKAPAATTPAAKQ
jgi:hypothetical protein